MAEPKPGSIRHIAQVHGVDVAVRYAFLLWLARLGWIAFGVALTLIITRPWER